MESSIGLSRDEHRGIQDAMALNAPRNDLIDVQVIGSDVEASGETL